MKRSKRYKAYREKVDPLKSFTLEEALDILKEGNNSKFDESLEVAFRLGVDPKHADQMVRGTVALPHGTGKTIRIVVFAQGEKATEATEAGADVVGAEDLGEKIRGGWSEFDVCVATPDMMKVVGKLGKILGPKGLMPSPKAGTVTMDIGRTIKELKGGRIEFRVDKQANIAAAVGKMSFDKEKLIENVRTLAEAIIKSKLSPSKGTYMLNASICSTRSPGIKLDQSSLTS